MGFPTTEPRRREPRFPRAAVAIVKDGVPSDDDFPRPPSDGVLAGDRLNHDLYIRLGGVWLKVAVA